MLADTTGCACGVGGNQGLEVGVKLERVVGQKISESISVNNPHSY